MIERNDELPYISPTRDHNSSIQRKNVCFQSVLMGNSSTTLSVPSGNHVLSSPCSSIILLSDCEDVTEGLHRVTNRFRDQRMEESYQLDSSMDAFPIARRIMLFVLGFMFFAYGFFWYLQHDCIFSHETSCHQYTLYSKWTSATIRQRGQEYFIAMWIFAPFALLYGVFPIHYLERGMHLRIVVYYVRRRWKSIAACIILLWAIGLDLYLYHILFFGVRKARQDIIDHTNETICARKTPIPITWYETSRFFERDENKRKISPFISVSYYILIYQSKIISSIIMGMLAMVATMTGIVTLTLKLEFRHVLFNSCALCLTTLCLVIFGESFSKNSRALHNTANSIFMFLCAFFPTSLTLLATYTKERAARVAYASKLRAERMNTTLKLNLSIKRMGLENRHVPLDKERIEQVLFKPTLQNVFISFRDLQLKDVLAKNPYGEILLAEYHHTNVVFKRLPSSCCTLEGIETFINVVEILTLIRHPNIVLFLGATYDNLANVGIIMEYLEQGDVFSLLRGTIPLSWSDPLLKIATDTALGMSYLHNCTPPLVHRDLKSSNLLCTSTFSCKISDFGESKRLNKELFHTMVGTPYWLAPEILREDKYDMSVDCYSFGIVLIELETRKEPYHDVKNYTTIDIMLQVANGMLSPTIPTTCLPCRRDLITRCLDPIPERRPKMTEILSILQHEVRKELMEPSVLHPTPDCQRAIRMQRHQRLNRQGVGQILQLTTSVEVHL